MVMSRTPARINILANTIVDTYTEEDLEEIVFDMLCNRYWSKSGGNKYFELDSKLYDMEWADE